MRRNKKGQVFDQFGGLATGIAALAILLVIAFLIMSTGKTQQTELLTVTTFPNQTLTSVTFEAFTDLGTDCVRNANLILVELYPNSTGSDVINLNNATVAYDLVNFSNKTGDFTSSTFNVTYNCKVADEGYNSTETLQKATDSIPGWVPIIIITFVGVILLGLVALFRRRD